jgi:hypothetical protein
VVIAAVMTMVFSASTALAVDTQLPIGSHDNVGGTYARRGECVAAGWAVDPDSPTDRVTVRISVDGNLLTTVLADQYRQDLVDAGVPGDGFSGFHVFMGGLGISFDVQHSILIEAQDLQTGQWTHLDGTPQNITCTNIAGQHDGNEGTVSRFDCVASGWAADFDTPTGPRARVRVIVDGKVVAETTADQFRQDVIDAGYPTDGYVGWSVDLFGRLTPGVDHSVTAEVRDTDLKKVWVPVFDAPRHITCMPTSATPGTAYGFAGHYTATDCATWWEENPDGSHDIDCSIWGDGSAMTLDIAMGAQPRVELVDSYATFCANANLPTTFTAVGSGTFLDANNLEVTFADTFCGTVALGEGEPLGLYGPVPTLWNDPDGDGWGTVWYPAP